ncbi:uncharacterized protein PFL1_00143 [Pseudozyma flocculosa PF-1]|uniref:Uncharacterized protein n=1 Tax=Pseudozyma flocculosa TaxID=84751 RepID=A0A5C3ES52_9BASI|nr:uncharacterized protein PFL1_00143 [Pseudozyma flocculosa PF-1]EPQ31944.1 hypothetical protein PFL1_00143 [Pseudozyma flocculosa PF-1]SPO35143.1 uncharacterized protein PSFLO_00614 [Pseudozyma flocculosa]
MPSQSARQRNKRALATTGSAQKLPTRPSSASGSQPTRLRSLLSILLVTSVLLVGLQALRFYLRGSTALSPLAAWTRSKYTADSKIASAASKLDRGATGFNPLAPEGAKPGAPALAPGLEVADYEKYLEQEGEIDVQYDEDGNLDLATAQRMLDLLYRPARDGVKVAGKMAAAMIEDEIVEEAADDAEVQDEAAP